MSTSLDPTLRGLNDCGCCAGASPETPAAVVNRPGLSAIVYRAGTHAQFKDTLLAGLSTSALPVLQGLTTRDNDDFCIALLDSWAAVADVLTFYQERFANESYLRTATERRSVLELARLIGYQLRPGVAASTYLAFTVESAPGALGQALSLGTTAQKLPAPPPPVTIEAGAKVQSVPGPGEQAQTFETVEQMEARAEWSAIRPRLTQPQTLSTAPDFVILEGTATNLKRGDSLMISDGSQRTLLTVLQVMPDEKAKTTRVDFVLPAEALPQFVRPTLPEGAVTDFAEKLALDDGVVSDIISRVWREEDLSALAAIQGWDLVELGADIASRTALRTYPAGSGVFALGQRAAIFGHNAPRWDSLPPALRYGEQHVDDSNTTIAVPAAFSDWEGRTLEQEADPTSNRRSIFLDNTYPGITRDRWLALVSTPASGTGTLDPAFYEVKTNVEITRSDFAISAKVSRLRVAASSAFPDDFRIRSTTVLAQSEEFAPADLPIDEPVGGDSITLDGPYLGLKAGRRMILTGNRTDLEGTLASEAILLKEVLIEGGFAVVTLESSLENVYRRSTVTINANVALATHGETIKEVLGSGNGGESFQRFTLRQPPLTHVSAPNATGTETTLELRVNDLLWREAPSFYGHGADERIYITRLDDDGNTTAIFGDGKAGARLPTGQENIRAKYRKGIGLGGLVKANQLTQLMTRPHGVKGVTNPNAATGAADRESLDDARVNAPLTILTLDRIVSLQDYEDFARAFAGIDKALATWTWNGQTRGVFVTVAGAGGAKVAEDSELFHNLINAMGAAGDPTVPLSVASYTQCFFQVEADVKVHPDYIAEHVLAAVETRLRERFSFEEREFGQDVSQSEVIAAMHTVAGVEGLDLNALYRTDSPSTLHTVLEVAAPRPGTGAVFPAELLTLDPRPVALEVLR